MKAGIYGLFVFAAFLIGCATQTPPVQQVEGPQSIEAQKKAQAEVVGQVPVKPTLKHKIAVGRMSNESGYGRSLLRDKNDDPLGKQVVDMMVKALVESGSYIVVERPDIALLKDEADLSGKKLDLVGVDALVIGSVTELGRKVVGKTGFLSDSKKQIAFAKLDVRLVDASTGFILTSVSGAGEASTETASVVGFGSQASYDVTLNDTAIREAVSDVVSRMSTELLKRRWQTSVLQAKDDQVFISGGKQQGVLAGMVFDVLTRGERVKSQQTGFFVTLPGKAVAQIKVTSNFGETIMDEGSVATIVSGKIDGIALADLVVVAKE
jgi:curli biogenesis system outer membrane secretion channel CsgG